MFTKKTPAVSAGLQEAIDTAISELASYPSDSPEYAKSVDQIVKLHALKTSESPQRVSPDALVAVTGNLAGILMIVGYEQKHVVVSKALAFVGKFR